MSVNDPRRQPGYVRVVQAMDTNPVRAASALLLLQMVQAIEAGDLVPELHVSDEALTTWCEKAALVHHILVEEIPPHPNGEMRVIAAMGPAADRRNLS